MVGSYRSQRLALSSGERTWTMLGEDHWMVEPAEEYLEYLLAQQASSNTVKLARNPPTQQCPIESLERHLSLTSPDLR